jgi:tRNA dimethylallyltransferase
MDIGTAKPSVEERQSIPHHLLDIVNPDERFNAADFKMRALEAIEAIASRGKLPILVGGTGLYVDAVLFDFQFGEAADPAQRTKFELLSINELQNLLHKKGYAIPENSNNKRYLVRALERHGETGEHSELRANTLVIGLRVDRQVLKQRIITRVDTMVNAGFVREYRSLRERYDADAPGFLAPGYKAFEKYLEGLLTIDEAKQTFVRNDWKLAKRQRTWFQRNKSIRWVNNQDEAVEIVTTFLNKYRSKQ